MTQDQLMIDIKNLPQHLQEEVKDFVDFLHYKYGKQSNRDKEELQQRKAGFLKGTFKTAPDFDEPLEDFKEYM